MKNLSVLVLARNDEIDDEIDFQNYISRVEEPYFRVLKLLSMDLLGCFALLSMKFSFVIRDVF